MVKNETNKNPLEQGQNPDLGSDKEGLGLDQVGLEQVEALDSKEPLVDTSNEGGDDLSHNGSIEVEAIGSTAQPEVAPQEPGAILDSSDHKETLGKEIIEHKELGNADVASDLMETVLGPETEIKT